jgi:hypothetical protein
MSGGRPSKSLLFPQLKPQQIVTHNGHKAPSTGDESHQPRWKFIEYVDGLKDNLGGIVGNSACNLQKKRKASSKEVFLQTFS